VPVGALPLIAAVDSESPHVGLPATRLQCLPEPHWMAAHAVACSTVTARSTLSRAAARSSTVLTLAAADAFSVARKPPRTAVTCETGSFDDDDEPPPSPGLSTVNCVTKSASVGSVTTIDTPVASVVSAPKALLTTTVTVVVLPSVGDGNVTDVSIGDGDDGRSTMLCAGVRV
jgi:hypothetical protein